MLVLHGIIFLAAFLGLWKKKLEKKTGILILCGNMLGLALTAGAGLSGERTVTELERQAGESREISLEAEDASGRRQQITLEIPELQYTPTEARKLLQEKLEELDGLILGENSSLREIRSDLNLPGSFADSPVTIQWRSKDPQLLDSSGQLGEEIPEEGAEVELEGTLTLQEEELLYIRTLRLYPPAEELDFSGMLQREAKALNESGDGKIYRLPETVDGQPIRWFFRKEETGAYIAGLFLAAGLFLTVSEKNRKWKQQQKRREEMKREYPEIIGRIQLLLGAGMSMRRIFGKITEDYKKQQRAGRKEEKPAYEEIACTYYEMEGGTPEQEAYEHLGERSRLTDYKNLSVLLVQNLKKGKRELIPLMEQEVRAALEERRRRARAEGEKAATRLLLPMGMMLLVVLILVVVPVFLSL